MATLIFFFGDIDEQIYPEKKDVFVNTTYEEFNIRYRVKNEEYNFIVVTSEHSNQYKLMFDTSFPYYSSYFIASESSKILSDTINKFEEGYEFKRFNPFSDKTLQNELYNDYIRDIIEIFYQMYDAGYLEKKTVKRVDCWIVACTQCSMKRFLEIYGIKPLLPLSETTYQETFTKNPQFRKVIATTMKLFLENFCVNNGIVKFKSLNDTSEKMRDKLLEF